MVAIVGVIEPGNGRATVGRGGSGHLEDGKFLAAGSAGIRVKQQGIDPTKDGGGGGKAQGQGEYGDGGKAAAAGEDAEGEAQILKERSHGTGPTMQFGGYM